VPNPFPFCFKPVSNPFPTRFKPVSTGLKPVANPLLKPVVKTRFRPVSNPSVFNQYQTCDKPISKPLRAQARFKTVSDPSNTVSIPCKTCRKRAANTLGACCKHNWEQVVNMQGTRAHMFKYVCGATYVETSITTKCIDWLNA
jgi:hypothetical protein